MAKDNEEAYISALQDFSRSVEHLVEAIKSQVKANTDGLPGLIGSTKDEAQQLADVAEQLSVISETVKNTKSDTSEILTLIKGIKKQKQTGIWEKLNPKDKVKGVAEGISTVALMAGSILAIGTAFKIVGDVDFESVLALSIALPLMAIAFAKVGETTSDPKEAAGIAMSMIIMAAGIAVSGDIISEMPSLSFMQMVSAIAVSATMAVAMYGMSMAADNLNNSYAGLFGIALAMPFIASAIVASGDILQDIPQITLEQFLSTLGVGVALGASMIPLAIAARSVGGDIGKMFGIAILMPVFAASIYASALVLKDVPDIDTIGVLEASFAVTAAGVIMGTGIFALKKFGLNIKDVALGTLSLTIMSAGLMASSWILSVGNYDNYPSVDWAAGVGLSMLGYLPSVMITGAIAATGIGAIVLAAGVAAMTGIASGLVATSHIISKGKYVGGPSKEWAEGVGLSLVSFGQAISLMSPGLIGSLMGETMDDKIKTIVKLGAALVDVAEVVKGGDYTGGPKKEWANGVGLSIKYFADALDSVKPGFFDRFFGDSLETQLQSMVKMAAVLPAIGEAIGKDTSMYTGGPKKEWAEGVGISISAFATAIATLADEIDIDELDMWIPAMKKIAPLIKDFGWMMNKVPFDNYPSKNWSKGVLSFIEGFSNISIGNNVNHQTIQVKKLASSFLYLAKSINSISYSLKKIKDVPDLSGIYSGLVTLSLIDNSNLFRVLSTLDKKRDEFNKLLTMINAASQTSINDASFGGGNDKTPKVITPRGGNIPVTTGGNDKTPKVITPPTNTIKTDNTEKLLSQLIQLQSQMNSVLNEIADNTSQKITPTNISH